MKRLALCALLGVLWSPAVAGARAPKCGDEPYRDPATKKLWITWVTPLSAEEQVTLIGKGRFPSLGAASDKGIAGHHETWRTETIKRKQLDKATEPPPFARCAEMGFGKWRKAATMGELRSWEKATYNIDPDDAARPIQLRYEQDGRAFFAVGLEHAPVGDPERHGLVNATPVLTHAIVVPGPKVESYVRSIVLSRDDGRRSQHCFLTPGVRIVSNARADGGIWVARQLAALHQEPATRLVVDLLTDGKKPAPRVDQPDLSPQDLGIVTLNKVSYRGTRLAIQLDPRPADDLILTWK
jgi:hypothetical protein